MTFKLFVQAISKFILGVLITGLLIFLPAGTILFLNGLLFMAVLFVPMFCAGVVMMIKNPELLEKRLKAKEKQKSQDAIVKLTGLIFVVAFVLAGLNFRFSWHLLPKTVVYIAIGCFVVAYIVYAEVLRENTYLSRTIEIQNNQTIVSTGLYSVVRHPMYSATLVLFLSMPLILGSIFSFFLLLIYPFLIVQRIKKEEELLKKELQGYTEYTQKVKYRIIPYLW